MYATNRKWSDSGAVTTGSYLRSETKRSETSEVNIKYPGDGEYPVPNQESLLWLAHSRAQTLKRIPFRPAVRTVFEFHGADGRVLLKIERVFGPD